MLSSLLGVVCDIRLKVWTGRKADAPMNMNQLHSAIKIEPKEMSVHHVFSLRKERADQLSAEWTRSPEVLGAELVLLFTSDSSLYSHGLRRERVVVIALMELGRVVHIHFEDVVLLAAYTRDLEKPSPETQPSHHGRHPHSPTRTHCQEEAATMPSRIDYSRRRRVCMMTALIDHRVAPCTCCSHARIELRRDRVLLGRSVESCDTFPDP